MRKTAFVKISGDLIHMDAILEWIRNLTRDYFVVVCTGGGSQISETLDARGLKSHFGPLGRELDSFVSRQIARDVLEENQAAVQDLLASKGIPAVVIIPVLDIGSVLCHVNGDVYTTAAYLGFDRVIIMTTREREEKKRAETAHLSKIEVIGF